MTELEKIETHIKNDVDSNLCCMVAELNQT